MATINVNGLREAEKKDALALFLIDFRVAVCVVSETHLRDSEITGVKKYFLDYGYQLASWDCRNTGEARIRGGF